MIQKLLNMHIHHRQGNVLRCFFAYVSEPTWALHSPCKYRFSLVCQRWLTTCIVDGKGACSSLVMGHNKLSWSHPSHHIPVTCVSACVRACMRSMTVGATSSEPCHMELQQCKKSFYPEWNQRAQRTCDCNRKVGMKVIKRNRDGRKAGRQEIWMVKVKRKKERCRNREEE